MSDLEKFFMVCGSCGNKHLYKTKENGSQNDIAPMYSECPSCGSRDWTKTKDGTLLLT